MGRRLSAVFLLLVVADYFSNGSIAQSVFPDCVSGPGNTSYIVFTRANPEGVVVDMDSEIIPVDKNLSTVFVTHGWTGFPNRTNLTNALCVSLVSKYNVNVISVNWTEGACSTGGNNITQIAAYPSAVNNAKLVAVDVVQFIVKLITQFGLELAKIIMIGHSVGAHLVGFCGKYIQDNGIGKLTRVVGLDPAKPEFEGTPCPDRLCSTDADVVLTMHTNAAAFGIYSTLGPIDFFMNGGLYQSRCLSSVDPLCSHKSAIRYSVLSTNSNCNYVGKIWNRIGPPPTLDCSQTTCCEFGLLSSNCPINGTYYVDTTTMSADCNNIS